MHIYDDIVFQLLHMYSNKYISINAKQTSKTDNTDMQVSVASIYAFIYLQYLWMYIHS